MDNEASSSSKEAAAAEAALKRRAANYTFLEKEKLINIIQGYKSIIENKKTDAVSVKCKKETWQKICDEFNAASPNLQYRPVESLKKFYEKQKEDLRKRYANAKKELYTTGGGPEVKNDNQLDDLLMSFINTKSVKGLGSTFDSNTAPQGQIICDESTKISEKQNSLDDSNIEFVYVDDMSKPEELENDWKKANSLKRPISKELQENVKKICGTPRATPSLNSSEKMSRRRPRAVVPLTSSRLGEKYESLVDKKLELVESLKKEHLLRLESLKLDIALKKKALNAYNNKDSDEYILESPMLC